MRAFYSQPISEFLDSPAERLLGFLAASSTFDVDTAQRDAWIVEIEVLKPALTAYRDRGTILLEYSIPRLGRRVDAIALIDHVVFVIEFKVGEDHFPAHAIDQVYDYALDLKNFHEPSHALVLAPILVATEARSPSPEPALVKHQDKLLEPICTNAEGLRSVLAHVLEQVDGPVIAPQEWESGRYRPTPTIIEAATALYAGHSVADISRSGAEEINLTQTSNEISQIIEAARAHTQKSICLVTGVPGAGKTLVGLNIATRHIDPDSELYSVFLSGNGPLVAILREALARDTIRRAKERGTRERKGQALSKVKAFIQNVHHFRDDCLQDIKHPPIEHVALFDEAQRAWTREQTAKFMKRKKKVDKFSMSEPEFLISCLDRHRDWAVVVCLVGGGQEINTGEAGIGAWIDALREGFSDWHIHISPRLTDSEYAAGRAIQGLAGRPRVHWNEALHLAVSMRSFRAERVSLLVKQILDLDLHAARATLASVSPNYPMVLSRDLSRAKRWLRERARGSERYGMVVSSQAERLKPYAIDVRAPLNPVHWFLADKSDVRSSYYLEDAATEFHVQGLELDWACVAWDADFRFRPNGWEHWSFKGNRWQRINQPERQSYLKNAYRVLLTRARQGMAIVVPEGDSEDATRPRAYYDSTFDYLCDVGFAVI